MGEKTIDSDYYYTYTSGDSVGARLDVVFKDAFHDDIVERLIHKFVHVFFVNAPSLDCKSTHRR